MAFLVDFRPPRTVTELSVLLGTDETLLARAIASDPADTVFPSLYLQHRIPKRRGAFADVRVVWAVTNESLRDAHRAFARRFDLFARHVDKRHPHDAAYGYIRGRGTRDNAKPHCGSRWLFRADIANFFDSISCDMLVSRFRSLAINEEGAQLIAAFSTINGRLALGLNASPLLANLICTELDIQLAELAIGHDCRYTRYADDIFFSGDSVPTFADVAALVERAGFELPNRKHRLTKNGQAHFVTGLSVSDATAPHAPRRLKRRLRQELYYCRKYGIASHLERIGESRMQRGINRIDGTVRYIGSAERSRYVEMSKQWAGSLAAHELAVSYAPRPTASPRQVTLLVDESVVTTADGGSILSVACVSTIAPAYIADTATTLAREHLIDPFSSTRKRPLEKLGLHFTDAHEELRTDYVARLAFLPFRGYVAFGSLQPTDQYEERYLELLSALLPRRFMATDGDEVQIVVEQNPQIALSKVDELVGSTYAELERRNDRRPVTCPKVTLGTKQSDPALTVPDFLLGVFGRYFCCNPAVGVTDLNRFERLRDKFRHIVNVDTHEDFSRRHPLEK